MKKLEIEALNLDDAKRKAFEKGITVIFNITRWWAICGKPTGDDLITLVVKYLQRRDAFENEGVGVIINITKPSEKKHRWPYKLNKGSLEKIRYKRVVEIRKKSNDELLAIAKNRKEAITLSKELIPSIQEDIYGRIIYQPNRYEFELNYIPNDIYKYGQYIVFGVEDADVRASKRKRRSYI